jgi:hypothetical protein
MAKVIVERPRRGSEKSARKGRTRVLENEDGEGLRVRAPMGKPRPTKYLNENLAPLRRFLQGQVGRPWNKVYAEISEHLKPTNTVQQHVRDHIEDFVAVKTRMEQGEVVVTSRFRGNDLKLSESYHRLYVHPRTGLLCANKNWGTWSAKRKAADKARKGKRADRMREIDAATQLHRLRDDVWWEVKLAKIKKHTRRVPDSRGKMAGSIFEEPHTDVVLGAGLSGMAPEELYGRAGVYAIAKRQLNKADLKKHALR